MNIPTLTVSVFCFCIICSSCAVRRTPDYHVKIAGKYYRRGDYRKAEEECRRALLLYPFHKEAQFNLGNAYVQLEEWDNAVKAFQQAIWIKDTYPEPHYGMAVVHARLGKLVKSREFLKRYLQFRPHDQNARELMKKIEGDLER